MLGVSSIDLRTNLIRIEVTVIECVVAKCLQPRPVRRCASASERRTICPGSAVGFVHPGSPQVKPDG